MSRRTLFALVIIIGILFVGYAEYTVLSHCHSQAKFDTLLQEFSNNANNSSLLECKKIKFLELTS